MYLLRLLANLATAAKTQVSSDESTVISGLDAGYYLIKDTVAVEGNDAATKFIIKIVKNTTAEPKTGVPTVEKKLQDDDDGVADQWQDVADYDIGDKVPFKLTGTMPTNIADYKTYKYTFKDTLSAGLTFNNDVVVTVDGTTIDSSKYSVDANGTSIDIAFTDVKALGVDITADTKIVVTYSATLNEDAIIGLDGNPNEVYLEFSNNPNKGGEGETGETPKDQVVVFTYELDTTKVDGADTTKKLEGAEFKLQNAAGKWVTVDANGKVTGWVADKEAGSTLISGPDGLFKVIGLDEGTYSLYETKAPAGYNCPVNPFTLVIKADDLHDVEYLGDNASACLTAIKLDGKAGDTTSGVVNAEVQNNQGSTLPETGGIGTTIFYVGGAIVVVGALVLLIVKRRMNTEA